MLALRVISTKTNLKKKHIIYAKVIFFLAKALLEKEILYNSYTLLIVRVFAKSNRTERNKSKCARIHWRQNKTRCNMKNANITYFYILLHSIYVVIV